MNTSLLGLSTYSSDLNLNGSLIDKLKTSETNSINKSLSLSLDKLNNTTTISTYFISKLNNLLSLSKEKISNFSANTSGENIIFNSSDESKIKEGFYSFDVSSVAKRDVYQTNEFSNDSDLYGNEVLTIKGINIDTTGKTFKEVNDEINNIEGVISSIEDISSSSKRLVIKSEVSGIDNSLNVNSTELNKIQSATNLNLSVDGITYSLQENVFNYNGMNLSINNTGISTINIKKDTTQAKEQFDAIISGYNDLMSYTNDTILYNTEFHGDKSVFKETISNIKNKLFSNDLFSLGASLDKDGLISISTDIPLNNMNSFTTDIKDLITDLTSENGILNKYKETQNLLKTNIEKEMENNLNYLNEKYDNLASQFVSYNSLIISFESKFSSLKQLINSQNN